MKMSLYVKTWRGALAENKFSRYIILLLSITVLVLAISLMGKDTKIVLVPPEMTQESAVASNNADAPYKEAWATYVAMMLGNATPRTAPYISESIGKLMSPAVYRTMMDGLTEQASRISDEQLTIQFSPNQTFYLPAKDVVVVTGEYVIRGMQASEQRMVRTYEIGIDVSNYVVRVDSLTAYEGAWSVKREEAEAVEAKRAREEERVTKETTKDGK